jgi:hypothetical protein
MCLVWARLRQTAVALQVKKRTSLMTITTRADTTQQKLLLHHLIVSKQGLAS